MRASLRLLLSSASARVFGSLLLLIAFSWAHAAGDVTGVWTPQSTVEGIVPLQASCDYLIDPTAQMSIDDIVDKEQSHFAKIRDKDLKFPTNDGAVWVRFKGNFSKYNFSHWFLLQNYEHVAMMRVYYPDGSGYKFEEQSENTPIVQKKIAVHNYIFKIPTSKTVGTYYIRYLPQGHNVIVDLSWSSESGLIKGIANTHLEEGLFFGGLVVMWFYNCFLFLYLREKTYLYYIYYLGAFIGTFVYIDGFMPALIGMSNFKEEIFASFPFFALNGMVVFGRTFLDVREPGTFVNRYLWAAQHVALICSISPFLMARGHSFDIANILIILILPALFVAGIWRMFRGYKPAIFYFAGWSFFAVALCLLALKSLLLIPESWLTDYAIKFAATWEAVVFSFALAYRLRLGEKIISEKADQAMKNLQSSLEREKLAVKKNVQFIAAVNHELRSPLQRLINGYDTIAAGSGLDDSDPKIVNLRRIADQIVNQMKDIGDFSRLEADVLEPRRVRFSIGDIMFGMREDFEEILLEKNISMAINIENGAAPVFGDRDRIRQVISNLVQNAVKFTVVGGVTVTGALEHIGGRESLRDAAMLFSISDTGRGIPLDEIKLIFEPFWQGRTAEKQLGSGLGLAIVKRLSDLLGANINVKSDVGSGTTFTVRFPVIFDKDG